MSENATRGTVEQLTINGGGRTGVDGVGGGVYFVEKIPMG